MVCVPDIVNLVFSHLDVWSGNLFLIAPFPDLCLLIFFFTKCSELIVPRRYFCGGSYCFMFWCLNVFYGSFCFMSRCLKYFCAVGALCMFAYF